MIQNHRELLAGPSSPSLRRMRGDALEAYLAALRAVHPGDAVRRWVRRRGSRLNVGDLELDLSEIRAVRMISFGKASVLMAEALGDILELDEGLVVTDQAAGHGGEPSELVRAGHPEPDHGSLEAGRKALEIARRSGPADLLFVLVSGGGSAMLEDSPVSLKALREVSLRANLRGIDIRELNAVRKHVSNIKGGQLARAALISGARVISLAMSDVVGDPLSSIASGPTVPDETTFGEARDILERYGLWDEVSEEIRERIEAGIRGDVAETPKPSDPAFDGVRSFVIANNRMACEGAVVELQGRGYNPLLLTTELRGEARETSRLLVERAVSVEESDTPIQRPAAVVAGGETWVMVQGKGVGGRCQELALAAVEALSGRDIVLLSCGTDGRDGQSDAAGAIVDGETLERAMELDMDPRRYLSRNDSYTFFRRLDDAVLTGATGTNVMDVQMLLVGPPA